jgi:hypothetical protein
MNTAESSLKTAFSCQEMGEDLTYIDAICSVLPISPRMKV